MAPYNNNVIGVGYLLFVLLSSSLLSGAYRIPSVVHVHRDGNSIIHHDTRPTKAALPLRMTHSTSSTLPAQHDSTSKLNNFKSGLKKFAKTNWLVIGEVIVIVFAKLFPWIGCTGGPLKPEFFISKCGVFTIFFINGISISLNQDDSGKAKVVGKTNVLIPFYNMVFIPLVTILLAPLYPNKAFRDGLLVLSVIPTTINICVAQTLSAGGDMPLVIFNAIFANLMGVVLTPLLTVLLLGSSGGKIRSSSPSPFAPSPYFSFSFFFFLFSFFSTSLVFRCFCSIYSVIDFFCIRTIRVYGCVRYFP